MKLHRSSASAIALLWTLNLACEAKKTDPEAQKQDAPKAAASKPTTDKPAAEKAKPPGPPSVPAPPDVAAPPKDAEKTASGLASKVLKPGDGERQAGRP